MIWLIACLPLGILLAWLAIWMLNRFPASWLCDYGETPSQELLNEKRVDFRREGVILSVLSVVSLVLCRLQFNKGFDIYFICFSLIILIAFMIAVCDIKYMIIPDQLTIAVGVVAAAISIYDIARGFKILHSTWWSPLVGVAVGAGVMLLIDLIGMLIYKKEGMGFGDVKLFAAVGILTGFPGTIYAFVLSLITATICFIIIIAVAKRKNAKTSPGSMDDTKDDTSKEETDVSVQSYLAFGPYIALATICYIILFDVIHTLANLYIDLF